MTWVLLGAAAIGAGGSIIGGNTQAQATKQSADTSRYIFDKQTELQAPFRQAGLKSQNRLLDLLGISDNTSSPDYGRYSRDFSMKDFQTDPGYSFRLGEGLKTLDRQAAARGGLISGGALKAAQRYGQDFASNEYQNAYNRYQTKRSNQINPLLSLTGAAQTATNQLSSDAGTYGANVSNAYMRGADATASSYINAGNALTSGLSSYLNYNQQNKLLDALSK